jgi:hypothetical protein
MENTDVISSSSISPPPHQTDTNAPVTTKENSTASSDVKGTCLNTHKIPYCVLNHNLIFLESIKKQSKEDEEVVSRPTIEITSLILEREQQAERKKLTKESAAADKEVEQAYSDANGDSEPETASKSFDESEPTRFDSVNNNNNNPEEKANQANGSSSLNSGLQAILVNLCEVIQQQLTPLLESVQLPGINIALATNSNGTFNLSSLQQQLAVAQVATATQIQRTSQSANPNHQRLLNTASILASQLGAAACAAAAVASSEGMRKPVALF